MKELTESQVNHIKEKLIKFKNELIRKNKFNNRIKKDLNNYNGIKDIRYLFNEYEDEYEDMRYLFNVTEDIYEGKIAYKEPPFKSMIVDTRIKLSKNGDRLIKKGLYYFEEMKSLGSAEIKNIKEKLIIFKNELIRKNMIKKDLDNYNGNTKYKVIKDIRYLFNEEDIYNNINDIKYLLNENEDHHEDKITHKNIKRDAYYAEKIKKNKIKITYKESPFKSIIQDIKKGLCYVEKTNNLSTSDIKNIKEKLVKFKNELFNNNNKIKKDSNEWKGIKYIRNSFNEDKNKKTNLYKAEKMKNVAVKNIKDLNKCKGFKDIRCLFNDNIYKGIIDIRYLFNEDYYVENIKSEF